MSASPSPVSGRRAVAGNRGAAKDASERRSFTEFLNGVHASGTPLFTGDVKELSLEDDGRELFEEVSKGVLFARLINHGWPGSIKESVLQVRDSREEYTPFETNQNHQLAIDCARDQLEVKVVNVGATDLTEGNASIVLGLLWQIIKKLLLKEVEELDQALLAELGGEAGAGKTAVKPEALIMRWANVVLERMTPETDVRVEDWGESVSDSKAYAHLLHALSPSKFDRDTLQETLSTRRPERRAQRIIDGAYSVFGPSTCLFVNADDIVGGNSKLNFAFATILFAHRTMLPSHLAGGSTSDLGHEDLMEPRRSHKKGTNGTDADVWIIEGDKTHFAEKAQLVWEHKSTGKLTVTLPGAGGSTLSLSRSDMQVVICNLWDLGLVITRGGPYKVAKASFHSPTLFLALPEEASAEAEDELADLKEWLDRCKIYTNKPQETELA